MSIEPILSVQEVTVTYESYGKRTMLCSGVTFDLYPGEVVGLVGESGSGKSITSMAVLGLLPPKARITQGVVSFNGENLANLSSKQMQKLRGAKIAYIAQDATSSLNPVLKIGTQITEVLKTHTSLYGKAAQKRAVELLEQVGITRPHERIHSFPHELSGGMRQRVVIAIALACQPEIIIADEPTTALDVTVQAQVIRLITDLAAQHETAVLLISHDLGVVSSITERTLVMYSGRIVETLPTHHLQGKARHPYTRALLEATPRLYGADKQRFTTVPGQPPTPVTRPPGCAFHPRCPRKLDICSVEVPPLTDGFACWNPVPVDEVMKGGDDGSTTSAT